MMPFSNFNFHVLFTLPDQKATICEAEFSECSGLEMNMEVKTIKEGGNNAEQIHLSGPLTYGQLSLKRGMTSNFDLWDWFEQSQQNPNLRIDGEIQMLSVKRTVKNKKALIKQTKNVVFKIFNCLPIKIVAPTLTAAEGEVAVEEMQIAYERLKREVSEEETED